MKWSVLMHQTRARGVDVALALENVDTATKTIDRLKQALWLT